MPNELINTLKNPEVKYIIYMGDSLSDRGEMAAKGPFMSRLSGVSGSPQGRFSNGWIFADYLSISLLTGLAPRLLTTTKMNQYRELLNDPMAISIKNCQDFVRSYCIGGLTAYNWDPRVTGNLVTEITEKILATLAKMRTELAKNDRESNRSDEQKKQTLVIEFSGANDLITVNTNPTEQDAELAAQGRIQNLRELIAQGYVNFEILLLPDLSLTPRYQRKSHNDRADIQTIVKFFNNRVTDEVLILKNNHAHCRINTFDTSTIFNQVFQNPVKYGLSEENKRLPMKEAPNNSVVPGAMFWDDVHPSESLHQIIAGTLRKSILDRYYFSVPRESFKENFVDAYARRLAQDTEGCFGFFSVSKLDYRNPALSLKDIFKHALFNKGNRTLSVLQKLKWLSETSVIAQSEEIIQAALSAKKEMEEAEDASSCCSTFFRGC